MLTVNVHEAKPISPSCLSRPMPGRKSSWPRPAVPYARPMPLAASSGKRQPGRLACRVDAAFFDPLPDVDLAAWEGK